MILGMIVGVFVVVVVIIITLSTVNTCCKMIVLLVISQIQFYIRCLAFPFVNSSFSRCLCI